MEFPDTFSYADEKGNLISFTTIMTFSDEGTKKDYVIYTNNKKNKDGDLEVFFAGYDKNSTTLKLIELEDEREYKMLKIVFEETRKQVVNK